MAPFVSRREVLAALSIAIDLGLGQPMEHMLRSAVIGTRLADLLRLTEEERSAVFHTSLLMWIGCHADSHEYAHWFGDDITVRHDSFAVDWSGLPYLRFLLRNVGRGLPVGKRAQIGATLIKDARGNLGKLVRSHCASASLLAEQFGLGEEVASALRFAFERWDGRGLPNGVAGTGIPIVMRVVQLADVVEVPHRAEGVEAAITVARGRSGGQLDPQLVSVLAGSARDLLGLPDDAWSAAAAALPDPDRIVTGAELDTLLQALGDFVDLKCPFTLGHSRGVAELAHAAASCAGLGPADADLMRRAGYVHDLGRIGVSNHIWEKPGPLTASEWERAQMHPYLTGRILSRVGGLEAVRAVAERHHEHLDGSGYPNGLTGGALSVNDRLLAAAVKYHSSREPRPYRVALDPDQAARRLRRDAAAGQLEPTAVETVLEAAGHRRSRRPARPSGLTPRETEVLINVAWGRSNREIANALGVSEKTVRNHVEHIYSKIGVTNRVGASLFATQHGMVSPVSP
ncbi:HD domain-containing phosphohydrolase [Nocardia sp. NPDC059228]|uniref:HD domain-containing phosphohydrolase n=1 Tax=Nocardia sp. NPDC059228 TaxID=3346777 RepID=UPI00369980E3